MTTIDLPSTLTAHASYIFGEDGETTPVVALYFGDYEVAAWPVNRDGRQRMADDDGALQAFVADKLAALFAPTVALSGCACGPQK